MRIRDLCGRRPLYLRNEGTTRGIYKRAIVLETAKQMVGTQRITKSKNVDLVEGTAPSETKIEFMYWVRAGQCGRTGHSMSNIPTFVCERERKKKTVG
jgi:hypothetical protein